MKSTSLREAYAALDNRGPGFETLRLVAASAVVLHHSMKIEHDIVRDDWLFQFSGGYTQLGLLAVSVFFALSGFLVTPGLAKTGNVIGYLSRRFMRIMPLLATVVLLTALAIGPLVSALPAAEYYASPVTWRYLKTVTTFLSLQLPGVTDYDGGNTINGPIWTLNFEWMCYLLLAGLAAVKVLARRWLFLGIYVLAMLALFFGPDPAAAGDAWRRTFMFLFLFGYFGAGVLLYLFNDVVRWSPWLMLAALAVLTGVYATPFDYIFAPILTAYLVVGIGLIRFPETPLTTGVDLSYGVYLSHSVILMVLMNVYPFQSWPALFAVCLALSYATAFLTWRFVESPGLRHKDLPERMVRAVIARVAWKRKEGAA
ncbi:MAG: acyltransferase [Erythrobacter sp.]|uniref:acyltransferase family protein n=1 Tax=Erythrobacter sp. TaxID=1042 RepID=UPI0025E00C28|nr:acyltransferase [Erythrobacter sp.]MCL9998908.1 acyltransferase [Erythrobacter sp.]